MGCCDCFGLWQRNRTSQDKSADQKNLKQYSEEHLLGVPSDDGIQKADKSTSPIVNPLSCYLVSFDDSVSSSHDKEQQHKHFKELKGGENVGEWKGLPAPRQPVKITRHAIRSEDFDGNKMINEYVRECKIGTGSYGKVVLHRSKKDHKLYALKVFHKSRLRKLRVAPSETAMMDVMREVEIMKQLDHPNIVNLLEVIDDPESDQLYMVMEYVEGRWLFEGSGPPGGIGEATARRYFRDIVAGLMYLHNHNVVHGDIKPENLLITSDGHIKIGDFGVSRSFENNNDTLRRSPGTPVFSAPECCLECPVPVKPGVTYHGKAADVWALGVSLYCMVFGRYPFLGETLQETFDKIVQDPLALSDDMSSDLRNLLEGILHKDPDQRLTLEVVACHPWVVKGYGPLKQQDS